MVHAPRLVAEGSWLMAKQNKVERKEQLTVANRFSDRAKNKELIDKCEEVVNVENKEKINSETPQTSKDELIHD